MGKPFVLGLDGCPSGWVVAALPVDPPLVAKLTIVPTIKTLFAYEQNSLRKAEMVMIDIPIGLADHGRRDAEKLARHHLGKRASSVFPAPRRPMLDFASYQEANHWGKKQAARDGVDGGGGLSKQAWNIIPKIRDVDQAISAADQTRIGEAHPELAFTRLNAMNACQYSKKTAEGAAERIALLKKAGIQNIQKTVSNFRQCVNTHNQHHKKDEKCRVTDDDLLDALAIALTARARLTSDALHLTTGQRDARGLVLEIWG